MGKKTGGLSMITLYEYSQMEEEGAIPEKIYPLRLGYMAGNMLDK